MTPLSVFIVAAAALLAPSDALNVRPAIPARVKPTIAARCIAAAPCVAVVHAWRPRSAAATMAIEDASDKATSRQIDLVERASDPFRVVRVVVYATFGVAGLAGVAISLFHMGKDPSRALSDLAINSAVLGAGVGVFFFDRKVTSDLRAKAEAEVKNPYLKGDAIFEGAEEADAQES